MQQLQDAHPGVFLTQEHVSTLTRMAQDHACGVDMCLVGRPGSGKSLLARLFASLHGYAGTGTEVVQLYKDMTSRDLCQSRSTDASGNTRWVLSPAVTAATKGKALLPLTTSLYWEF